MKKLLAIVLVALMSLTLLAGCAKEVECELCGETKKGKTVEMEGEKVDVCLDCEEKLEALEKAFS